MNAVLEMREVEFAYGSFQILFGVSLHVERGEILALLGTNGAGKSTLLRVATGLERPHAGSVVLDGQDVTGWPAERLCAAGLVQVPGGKAVFPDLTVLENLKVGAHLLRRRPSEAAERIEEVLQPFPVLRQRSRQTAGSLSGGEQQQLAIAKALLLRPKVLCIDELSLGLAPVVVEMLLDVVAAVRANGASLVIVEQSLNVAASLCDRAVFLEKGTVRFEGHPLELLQREDVARAVFLGGEQRPALSSRKRAAVTR